MGGRGRLKAAVLATMMMGGLIGAFSNVAGGEASEQGAAAAGARIYREGVLASGGVLTARFQGGIELSGAQAACINCHRRSGHGAGEGNSVIRSITGPSLYSPSSTPERKIHYLVLRQGGKIRPAYTDAALTKAIRDGIDISGAQLAEPMPRYDLNDEDMGHLISYLKSLAVTPSPGVTDDVLHFATIVSDGVDPGRRKAMEEMQQVFFHDKNAETRHETLRKEHGPWEMERWHKAYRKWQLHVWELQGAPDTWPRQLEEYYQQQPVFLVVGGMVNGSWRPMHEFCERNELPCLFPNTDLPIVSERDYFTVYMSQGIGLEARVLARFIGETSTPQTNMVQLFHDEFAEREAAAAFAEALRGQGGVVPAGLIVPAAGGLPRDYIKRLLADQHPSHLVVWSADVAAELLGQLRQARYDGKLYFPSAVAGALAVPKGFVDRVYYSYPYALPQQVEQGLLRMTSWMRNKGMVLSDTRVQANTYLALTQIGEALANMRGRFSRDYLLEEIERNLENSITRSVYPALSLGPGQRYASKGGYVVQVTPLDKGWEIKPVSQWVVP